jgi:hypothetical protein
LKFNTGAYLKFAAASYRGQTKLVPYKGRFNSQTAAGAFKRTRDWAKVIDGKSNRTRRRFFTDNCPVLRSKKSIKARANLFGADEHFPRRSPDLMAWDFALFSNFKSLLNKRMVRLAEKQASWTMEVFHRQVHGAFKTASRAAGACARGMPERLRRVVRAKGEILVD